MSFRLEAALVPPPLIEPVGTSADSKRDRLRVWVPVESK
jgi:hypothetical protein